jgi:hypothetical protein
MYVFRIHIRPQGGSASVKESFEYCLKNKILGVGWHYQLILCWIEEVLGSYVFRP